MIKIEISRGAKVKHSAYKKFGQTLILLVVILLVFSAGDSLRSQEQEHQIEKAKIFQEIYPVISESDLYCSFLILDEKNLDLKIIGGEREYERVLFNEADTVYINKGKRDGLEEGMLFLILEVGPKVKDFGHIAFKRGKASILVLEESKASAKIEKACGQVITGHYLIPFEEKEGLLGKDLGYDVPPVEADGAKGSIIYLQREYTQIGSGGWALIDLGEEDGLYFGQQLIIYRKVQEGVPIQILGNLIVIDVQKRTSTIKILSCKDVVMLGDRVQTRT